MGDLVDAISKLSPFGDKESFRVYLKAMQLYYKDSFQYVTDRKMLWYMNFVQPNVYVMVLEALRIARRYDSARGKTKNAPVDVQSVFRIALDINGDNYKLDKDAENLANMISSIPTGASDLAWKVKNEYARTINGMSRSFMSNLESCTSKQKSIHEENARSKKQLDAIKTIIASKLNPSIAAKYKSVSDILEPMIEYVNFAVGVIPFERFPVFKRKFDKLVDEKLTTKRGAPSRLFVDVLANYAEFVSRAAENVNALGALVHLPSFSQFSVEDILRVYDVLAKFVLSIDTANVVVENRNYKTDAIVNLTALLKAVSRRFEFVERRNAELSERCRDVEQKHADATLLREDDAERQNDLARTIEDLRSRLAASTEENDRLKNALLRCETDSEAVAREHAFVIKELQNVRDSRASSDENIRRLKESLNECLLGKQKMAEMAAEANAEIENARTEVRSLRETSRAKDAKTGELEDKIAALERDRAAAMESLSKYSRQLETSVEENRANVARIAYCENALREREEYNSRLEREKGEISDAATKLAEQIRYLENENINYKSEVTKLAHYANLEYAREMDRVKQERDEVGTTLERNNALYARTVESMTGEIGQLRRFVDDMSEAFRDIGSGGDDDDDDDMQRYLKVADKMFNVVIPVMERRDDVDATSLKALVNFRRNFNYRHALNVSEELRQCDRQIRTRNDLFSFVMHYWFFNRRFVPNVAPGEHKRIEADKLRLDQFRNVRYDYDSNDVGDTTDAETAALVEPFIDYFLRSYLDGYETIVDEKTRNGLAKYLFDNYFLFVADKRRLLDAIDTTSLSLCVTRRK